MITREPALLNLIATPVAVQWVHRLIGTLLAVAVVATFVVVMRRVRDRIARRYGGALLAMVIAQYGLGVATLLLLVPVPLGVAHQAMALVIFGVWLAWLHDVTRTGARVP